MVTVRVQVLVGAADKEDGRDAYNQSVRRGMSALNGGESADEHRILATTFISIHGNIPHVSEPFPYPVSSFPSWRDVFVAKRT